VFPVFPASPCLRCGDEEGVKPSDGKVQELYMYIAELESPRGDRAVSVTIDSGYNGRLCRLCTPVVLAVIASR